MMPGEVSQTTPPRRTRFVVVIAAMLVLAGFLVAWLFQHSGTSTTKTDANDPAIEAEWNSSDALVLDYPGTLQVLYRDLGDRVQLDIISDVTPVIFVDKDANHQVSAGDISYSARPDGTICIQKLVSPGSPLCGMSVTKATVLVKSNDAKEQMHHTVWTFPKQEMGFGKDSIDLMIQRFNPETQKGDLYPKSTPFSKVYRLKFREIGVGSSSLSHPNKEIPVVVATGSGLTTQPSPGSGPPIASPVVTSFEVAPLSGNPNAGFRLSWKVRGVKTVDITPSIGTVPAEGDKLVQPQETTRYVLTARNSTITISRDVTVALAPAEAPYIAVFGSNAMEVPIGSTAKLSWDVVGKATDIAIDPIGSGLPNKGSRDVTVNRTTSYVLTAKGPGGTTNETVIIKAHPLGPPSVTFEATPAAAHPGEPVRLSWTVTGADRVSIDPGLGLVEPSGERILHPLSNSHYVLSATGRSGETTNRDVSISVSRSGGATRGQLVWMGELHGTRNIVINDDHADFGVLQGALPGEQCFLQLTPEKTASIVDAPSPRNNYKRLILRVKGNGIVRVVIDWNL